MKSWAQVWLKPEFSPDRKFPSWDPGSRSCWCHPAWLAPWTNSPSHRRYHKNWSCCPDRLCWHIPDNWDRDHKQRLKLLSSSPHLKDSREWVWPWSTVGLGLFWQARLLGQHMWYYPYSWWIYCPGSSAAVSLYLDYLILLSCTAADYETSRFK